MELLSGGDMLLRALADEGVECIFGYPGGAALHIYDALFRQDKVKHVLVRHEQAATHAADGYARSTGKVGVVLVTSGPGATNAITGIATAYMDSIPMVVISGQVASDKIGEDAFQETDMVGISRPIVKHSFLVKDARDIPSIVKKAFYIAATGRPGPVVIDIPKDITNPADKFEYYYPEKVKLRSYTPVLRGHAGQIKKAVQLLLNAKRPIIYAGGGVILGNASQQLVDLARRLDAPVTNTLMGLGAFPGTDRQFVGMLGMHGFVEANFAMHHADVILAVGARFDDRVTNTPGKFCPNAKIIHVDIDPAAISKTVVADVPIVGPVDSVLNEMLELMASAEEKQDAKAIEEWWKQINEWRGRDCLKYATSDLVIKPQQVVESLFDVTKGDAFVTSDVGQHQMWAAQYYKFDKPRRWINSGGLGTMGVGLPYAMGVQMANPGKDVAVITGEASIQMNIQELSTCHQYRLTPKIVCLNNRFLGMVRQWQQIDYGSRYSESYMDSLPDFEKLAESFGHVGMKIEKPGDVDGAVREAFAMKDRLVFMNFITDQGENVWPMVKAGKGLSEMLLGSEDL